MKGNEYEIIPDREEAIKTAIENSEDDAVILIAGKGHETYQEIDSVRSHFSDKEIAEKYHIPSYANQRIKLVEKSINSLFMSDKIIKTKIDDFL